MDDIDWPLDIPDDSTAVWAAASADAKAQASSWAISVLWALSGRTFGTVAEHVRPTPRPPVTGSTYAGTLSSTYPGRRVAPPLTTGYDPGAGRGCRIAGVRLYLPGPIAEITEIRIDADVLPDVAYRIIDGQYVRRVDGEHWPLRQNLNADDGTPGAWSVTYRRGVPVPAAGRLAAGVLAVEYLNDREGRACRLPRGVTSASRQGLSIEVDARAYFTEGMTGVDEVDQWLLTVNPHRIGRPAQIIGGRQAVRRSLP
ncbi:head-tail adaptor [Gordonia phage Gaea]|uniref:Head-to-tail adaptor n=4 Tax=Kroosvirus TaxID=2948789 RepID=A0A3G3M865_9CAUD|nr:head-tail adaptor [Gordonia phage Kroos]YP_010001904.1 head-tail adaptor [Gordonia phage Gaea]YP_010001991.1 head-tail adaptor [Gordonia phage Bizzy]YP_010002161.1 head-tail adaptor [Gordonia phage Ribeye]UAJ15694.1 head-to-tail adaptor [Gordonia phage Baddon]AXH44890.1 head-to-tail adaptor [Gordonia phage Ribeye]AYR02663.1 head-to-tail adaptor [Gordonia phage Bizzy]AYR02834.1 head-to-tail adaptor [Gordonia phage Gaea]AYR03006.1 head-to-tail adaptor [Gordonia phage Kroos]